MILADARCSPLFTTLALAALLGMPIPESAAETPLGVEPKAAAKKPPPPVRVVCRERDSTFKSGQLVRRTLMIFNDTRTAEPIDMEWSFRSGGKAYAEGAETFSLEPGKAQEYLINFRTPTFPERTKGELVLTCLRSGQEVFRVVTPYIILGGITHGDARRE